MSILPMALSIQINFLFLTNNSLHFLIENKILAVLSYPSFDRTKMKTGKTVLNQQQQKRAEELYKKLGDVTDKSDLKKIMKTTTSQNERLIEQIKQLRNRVMTIRQRQKQEQEEKNKYLKNIKDHESNLKKAQGQLDKKYKRMKQLKEKLVEKNGGKIEDVENNKIKNMNEVANIEKTIQTLRADMKDMEKVKKKLQKTFEDIYKQQNVNEPRIKELQQQNQQMRAQISRIRQMDKQKQYDSIKVQNSLVDARRRVRDNEARRSMFNLKTINTDKKDLLALEKYEKLSRQVQQLRKQTQLVKEIEEIKYEEMKKIKNKLMDKNRENIKNMKDLDAKKIKLQQQNNLWKKKWQSICRSIEVFKNRKIKIDQETQYKQYEDTEPLRRDYAGILNRNRFEDRIILKDNKKAKIVGMIIYQSQRGIICLQALYDSGQKSYISLPSYALERCKVTKIQTSANDFFKLFKVKYNQLDNKVTKIEIRSNRNIKYQYGDKKPWGEVIEGDTIYGFDIGIKQFPVCIFGSYSHHKGQWFLQGFGVQINELDEADRI